MIILSLSIFVLMDFQTGSCQKEQKNGSSKDTSQDEEIIENIDILDILEILDELDVDFLQDDFFNNPAAIGEKDEKDAAKKK